MDPTRLEIASFEHVQESGSLPLPTFHPLGATGATGLWPTNVSSFFSQFRYETHLPTPGSMFPLLLLGLINKIQVRKNQHSPFLHI